MICMLESKEGQKFQLVFALTLNTIDLSTNKCSFLRNQITELN